MDELSDYDLQVSTGRLPRRPLHPAGPDDHRRPQPLPQRNRSGLGLHPHAPSHHRMLGNLARAIGQHDQGAAHDRAPATGRPGPATRPQALVVEGDGSRSDVEDPDGRC